MAQVQTPYGAGQQNSDGTVTITRSDGSTVIVNPDGSAKVTTSDGQTTTYDANGQGGQTTDANGNALTPQQIQQGNNNRGGALGPGLDALDPGGLINKAGTGIKNRIVSAANPQDPYNALAKTEDTVAGQADKLAQEQRQYIEQGGDTAISYLQPEQDAYNKVYGPGGSLSGPTNSQTAYEQTAAGLAGPSAIEQRYQQQLGTEDPFTTPGQAEDLYAARLKGNGYDPYSAMILDQGMKKDAASAAAAGNYNSGGRLAADALLTTGVNANIYQQMATEAQQAQSAESTRLGQDQSRQAYLSGLATDSTNAFAGRLSQIAAAASGADTQNQAQGNAAIKDQGAISGTAAGLSANTTKEASDAYGSAEGGALALQIAAQQARSQGTQAQNTQTTDLFKTALNKLTGGGGASSATPSAPTASTSASPYSPDGLLSPTWA